LNNKKKKWKPKDKYQSMRAKISSIWITI